MNKKGLEEITDAPFNLRLREILARPILCYPPSVAAKARWQSKFSFLAFPIESEHGLASRKTKKMVYCSLTFWGKKRRKKKMSD